MQSFIHYILNSSGVAHSPRPFLQANPRHHLHLSAPNSIKIYDFHALDASFSQLRRIRSQSLSSNVHTTPVLILTCSSCSPLTAHRSLHLTKLQYLAPASISRRFNHDIGTKAPGDAQSFSRTIKLYSTCGVVQSFPYSLVSLCFWSLCVPRATMDWMCVYHRVCASVGRLDEKMERERGAEYSTLPPLPADKQRARGLTNDAARWRSPLREVCACE